MYSITALWTAAHHRIPVTFVMLNNAAYRILKLNMLEYLGPAAARSQVRRHGPHRSRAALRPHGESMGVPARRVEQPDELAPALRDAIAHDGPSLVDVVMESPCPDAEHTDSAWPEPNGEHRHPLARSRAGC